MHNYSRGPFGGVSCESVGRRKAQQHAQEIQSHGGFTLVELLVALVVGLIAIGAIYSVYLVQQREYRGQQLRVIMHQNLRGAAAILEQEIRMAGFDPEESGFFGITDVRRYDSVGTMPDMDGEPALFYSMDLDENGMPDDRGKRHFNGDPYNCEFANFRIRDDNKSGRRYLAWDNGGGRCLLAESIQHVGFAYGIDADADGRRDTWNNGMHLIWAVDTDNDNALDTHLDANDDGVIDERDDSDNDGRITAADGGGINPPVALAHIRAVRIWLLAASDRPVKGHADHQVYVVGDQVVQADGDEFLRRLLETVVECRNL